MRVILKDFSGDIHEVEIPNETQVIAGINVSGDMVMIYPIYFDSDSHYRFDNYLEEPWSIERKDFDTIRNEAGQLDLTKLIRED